MFRKATLVHDPLSPQEHGGPYRSNSLGLITSLIMALARIFANSTLPSVQVLKEACESWTGNDEQANDIHCATKRMR